MLISFISTCSKSNTCITAKLLCVNKNKGVADQGSLRLYNINTIQKYGLVNYFKGIVKLRYSEIDTHCMILDILYFGATLYLKNSNKLSIMVMIWQYLKKRLPWDEQLNSHIFNRLLAQNCELKDSCNLHIWYRTSSHCATM